jgi:ferric-dicitrate binding protein FerR (iron transport regulator)
VSDDYLWDKSGEADPEIARLEKALARLRHEGEWREPPGREPTILAAPEPPVPARMAAPRRVFRRPAWIAGGALAMAAAIALAITVLRSGPDPTGPQANASASASVVVPAPLPTERPAPQEVCTASAEGFPFEATGPVTCGGAPAIKGHLPAGTWLETEEGSSASVKVADIGAIKLRGGSRLRIVGTGATEHRMELVRGSLHAKVNAPPRLFVIDTRAATAVDLGCEYDLRVDDQGRSHLRVAAGVVSLEGKGRAAHVPAGAGVTADPDRGPGVVIADGASPALAAAAERLDAGDTGALGDLLASARRGDSVTLWNLLVGTARETREKVVRRMEELSLRPAKVKREALLDGQPAALDALREHLEDDWFAVSPRIVTW